jgi:hypothetical protein
MRRKIIGAAVLGVAALVLVPAAAADEVVHFRNGAEMTIRSHKVSGDMVTLDLGAGNSIAFPLTMVDKIASAGRDVFLNPVYHPANQAVAGSGSPSGAPIPVLDTRVTGGGYPSSVRLPGGVASGPNFRPTGNLALPGAQVQRVNGVASEQMGPLRNVRKVVLPRDLAPADPERPTTVEAPQASAPKPVKRLTLVPQPNPSPAPAASSDGKTEAGTPPAKSN